MEYRILGPLEVLHEGQAVVLPGSREQVILALLLLSANRVVPAERLVEDVWGGRTPDGGVRSLHVFISRLRKALRAASGDSVVVTRASGYVVHLDADALDANRFDTLVAEGREHAAIGDHRHASARLRQALALWRGPVLADMAEVTGIRTEGSRLEQARLAALEERVAADLACGRHAELVPELDQLTSTYPLRERLWAHRMVALYRSGRQADALRACRDLRQILAEDLGLEPSPEIARLEHAILRQASELDGPGWSAAAVPAGAVRVGARHNLPVVLTPFVGRAAELEELGALVVESRLLTLTGVGGAGKTRLALQVAMGAQDAFPDGVWMAELGRVTDGAKVPAAVAEALEIETGPDRHGDAADRLIRVLEPRRALLLIDNCEHLLEAVARLVHTLLTGAPFLTVLATSRERLGVPGEVAWTVPPLSLPPVGATLEEVEASDAAKFFGQRAAMARRGFALDRSNADAVTRICRRLDGIPLALELAAARIQVISPDQVADRLDDRFRLLTGRDRIAVPRHQTLRATLDWSFELLATTDQAAFARLAVFPDTFDLAAAEAVMTGAPGEVPPDAVDVLSRLVDKSLVVVQGGGASPRYRLLETIRQYGAEKLAAAGEEAVTRSRHRDAFLARAEAWRGTHLGAEFLEGAFAERDNFFAALEWSWAEGNLDAVLRLVSKLFVSWLWWGSPESAEWIERVTSAPEFSGADLADHPNQIEARIIRAWFAPAGPDRAERQDELLREAAELAAQFGAAEPATTSAWIRGELKLLQGRPAEARPFFEAALAGFERFGLPDGVGWSQDHLGWVAVAERDYDKARSHFTQAVELARSDPLGAWLAPHAVGAMAALVAHAGDAPRAAGLAEEAVITARELGVRPVLAMALIRAAETAVLSGSIREAVPAIVEALGIIANLGSQRWLADALELTAIALERGGRSVEASVMLSTADGLRAAGGEADADIRLIGRQVEDTRDRLRAALGPEAFQAEADHGRQLDPEPAIALALSFLAGEQ